MSAANPMSPSDVVGAVSLPSASGDSVNGSCVETQETKKPGTGATGGSSGPTASAPADLEYTDECLAREFSDLNALRWKHTATRKQWYMWTGTYWRPDKVLRVWDDIRVFCRKKASILTNKEQNLANKVCSTAQATNIEKLARSDPRHAVPAEKWDSDPFLLCTPDGVVDLRAGQIRQAKPEDYCSKITAVGPHGDCPQWMAFLDAITIGDKELQAYLKRVAGYCLTGGTHEHALFFFYGAGGNGKSTFLETLKDILHDYATSVPLNTLMASQNDRHPTDMASLAGSRIAIATETDEGRQWDEVRVKVLTGGDKVKARFMRQDFFEFVPQFKLLISGNNMPTVRKVDAAIRRRFHLITFTAQFTNPDKEFRDKLRAEWPGILKWMVEGCVEWRQNGLSPPQAVVTATADYLDEEDAVGRWIKDRCELKADAKTTSAELFNSYSQWCVQNGETPVTKKSFTLSLTQRPGITTAKVGAESARGLQGIRLTCAAVPAGL